VIRVVIHHEDRGVFHKSSPNTASGAMAGLPL
jgi:hypothetical protein